MEYEKKSISRSTAWMVYKNAFKNRLYINVKNWGIKNTINSLHTYKILNQK
jgi:hypothetical protein